jgi:hypothetical protein
MLDQRRRNRHGHPDRNHDALTENHDDSRRNDCRGEAMRAGRLTGSRVVRDE